MISVSENGYVEIERSKLQLLFEISDVIIHLKKEKIITDKDIDFISYLGKKGYGKDISSEELDKKEKSVREKLALVALLAAATGDPKFMNEVSERINEFDEIMKELDELGKDYKK